jgi:GT2 family glycosyltransferase/SAM-dependent methyltransferase
MSSSVDRAARPDCRVAVVMVTYNSSAHVRAAIESLRTATVGATRLVVVDNASADDTVATVITVAPDAVVIKQDTNLGFARACNIGAEAAGDVEFLLFLNPDSWLDPGALDRALERMDADSGIGALGGRTRYDDGTINPTCCFARPTLWSAVCYATGLASLFRHSSLFNPEMMGGWDRDDTRDVDVVTGCFLLVSRSLFSSLGGFDERFFMYSEDTDLADRIRARGLRCVHAHDVGLVHLGGGSDVVKADKLAKVFRARRQYYNKHWPPARARLGTHLITGAVAVRLLGSIAGSSESRLQWRSIWQSRTMWNRHDGDRELAPVPPTGVPDTVPIAPGVQLTPKPFETRARIGYRVLRHIVRSARRGDHDFVRQGFSTALAVAWLTVTGPLRRERRACNVCGWQGPVFYPNTGPGYHDKGVTCPGCSSLDRHRSMLALLVAETDLFAPGKRIVEVAPMRGFEALLLSQPGIDYTSFDIERHAMERGDITAMRYATDSVDYFICFHVLEHIPDAAAALSEIRRVLKPGGAAVLQVPVDWEAATTREYDAPDPRDVGHVRQYGRDFPEHLERAGFEVTALCVDHSLPPDLVQRYGLSPEPIFLAVKSHD